MFVTRAHHEEVVRCLRQQIADMQVEREYLSERYHALKLAGAAVAEPLPDPPKSPLAQLGPKTQAALADEALGLPKTIVRAMRSKTLALHAEGVPDDQLAQIVKRGETNGTENGNGRH